MSNFEFIGKYISFLYRYGQIYLDRELMRFNIRSGQFYILMPLFANDGVNQESISQIIKVDKATITRSIQRLIDEGYVVRERDADDRRSYRVYLTEKGRAIKPEILAIAQRWDDILVFSLDVSQRKAIADSLDGIIEHVSSVVKK